MGNGKSGKWHRRQDVDDPGAAYAGIQPRSRHLPPRLLPVGDARDPGKLIQSV